MRGPYTDALICKACGQSVSTSMLDAMSERGEEHVCVPRNKETLAPRGPFVDAMRRAVLREPEDCRHETRSTTFPPGNVMAQSLTDAELRAECEWRRMRIGDHLGSCVESQRALVAERDEWKRRAETAERAEQAIAEEFSRVRIRDRALEGDAGISAMSPLPPSPKPDNSLDVDPLDLLCEDAP